MQYLDFYCPLRNPFLYMNRPDGRSKKAVCGFHKLGCQTVRCRNLPAWRYIAVGQFGKNFLAFIIEITL